MYLTIIILPLLGSLVSGFLGRKLGVKGSQVITTTCVVITTLLAIIVFFEVSLNHIMVSLNLFRWIDSESLMVNWGFNYDSLTVSMLIPVLIVSSLVHIYSIGYMSNDPHNQRFFSYLSLFTFMMIILVTANNYLLMFVGWEGVGVCSYLLVSFWFTRIAANQSSLAAFLTNRVGDCFLTIGMFVLLLTFGNISYSVIFSLSPYISEDIITLIGILLLLGAMAKSSQIGLHIWLPMAMEGPTPVSALIHAATMVTAGVYLLMRSSPLIEYSSTVLLACLWIGAITNLFSSLIGLFQQDIKKVIAYSTMSQLGMMVIAVGLSSYNLALFHLVNHAFYKALLFLGAGSVIHAVADNQDFRKYGGLKAFLPLTYSVMLIASLSLVAFPFMTGFYSKDFILESAYGNFSYSTTSVYFIATIGAMFTTLYSVKVLYLTFLSNPNGKMSLYKESHEGDIYMSLPLIILAIASIVFGYITKDLFIGLGSDIFSDNSIFIHPNHEITLDTEFAVPVFFKLLPLVFTISLSLIYIILSEFTSDKPNLIVNFKLSRFGYNLYSFFNQRFLIEAFYNKFITDFVLKIGGITTKVIDKGFIELIGPYGLERALTFIGSLFNNLSSGVVTSYALYIVIGIITLFGLNIGFSEYNFLFLIPFTFRNSYRLSFSKSLSVNISNFSTSNVLYMDNNDSDDNNDNDDSDDYSDDDRSRDSGFESNTHTTTEGERIDQHNGLYVDDTTRILRECNDRLSIDLYFKTKMEAMRDVLDAGTYQTSEQYHIDQILFLNEQKYDVLDLKDLLTDWDEDMHRSYGGTAYPYRPYPNYEELARQASRAGQADLNSYNQAADPETTENLGNTETNLPTELAQNTSDTETNLSTELAQNGSDSERLDYGSNTGNSTNPVAGVVSSDNINQLTADSSSNDQTNEENVNLPKNDNSTNEVPKVVITEEHAGTVGSTLTATSSMEEKPDLSSKKRAREESYDPEIGPSKKRRCDDSDPEIYSSTKKIKSDVKETSLNKEINVEIKSNDEPKDDGNNGPDSGSNTGDGYNPGGGSVPSGGTGGGADSGTANSSGNSRLISSNSIDDLLHIRDDLSHIRDDNDGLNLDYNDYLDLDYPSLLDPYYIYEPKPDFLTSVTDVVLEIIDEWLMNF